MIHDSPVAHRPLARGMCFRVSRDMTPEVLLWAHELKREQKNIWDRLKQLESAAPQQDESDHGVSVALVARIDALENQFRAFQTKQDAATGLNGRLADLETKISIIPDLRKDTAAAHAKAETASSEIKGISATFSLLDAEASDQAKEVKQIKDKIKVLVDGSTACNERLQEIEATSGESADRLNALDNNIAAFQHDHRDISDDLLATERKVAGIGKDMQNTKDGISNMLMELKWHLGQLYGHCEKIEIELGLEVEHEEEEAIAGSQEALPLETQPNLERRWDEECGSQFVLQAPADKPSPNTFKPRQRRIPADKSFARHSVHERHIDSALRLQQTNSTHSLDEQDPSFQRHRTINSNRTVEPQSYAHRNQELPMYPKQASLLSDSNDTYQRTSAEHVPYQTVAAEKQAVVPQTAVGQTQVRRRPVTPQIHVREEDIETQSPTPSPRPKPKQKRSTLQKETQLLLEPSIHSANRILQPLTQRTRRASHFHPHAHTPNGKENIQPHDDSLTVTSQQKSRNSNPALASMGKKRAAPASKQPPSGQRKKRSQAVDHPVQ